MKDFANKTAVITGAAHGIGRALAQKCADLKMRVVLVDINQKELLIVEEELLEKSVDVIAVVTDVTKEDEVKSLADKTIETFDVPDLLFNNAGVGGYVGPIWELSAEKLQWVMNVNFMSVVHGIQAFLPRMLEKKDQGHIINTSSMAGFYSFPYFSTYIVSKHSVIALSECLHHDLKRQGSNINVSVLCPGGVKTNILENSKKYPDLDKDQEFLESYSLEDTRYIANFAKLIKHGVSTEEIAEQVFQAIKDEKFYIITHPELKETVKGRMQAILDEKNPNMFMS